MKVKYFILEFNSCDIDKKTADTYFYVVLTVLISLTGLFLGVHLYHNA